MLKILIVGCGATGCHFACRLSRGNKILCYDADADLVKTIKRKGITVEGVGKTKTFAGIDIVSRAKYLQGVFDLMMMATKSYDTSQAARDVAGSCSALNILSLQNGLGNMEPLRKHFPDASLFCGVNTAAVEMVRPARIKIHQEGIIYAGSLNARYKDALFIKGIFQSAGFKVMALKNPFRAIWAKLIFNAAMNPLPVITGTDYRVLQTSHALFDLMREAMDEGKRVAKKRRIKLPYDPFRLVMDIRKGKYKRFSYKGSMYYDVMQNNPTEIDDITGRLILEAQHSGIKTPFLKTIYDLFKTAQPAAKTGE